MVIKSITNINYYYINVYIVIYNTTNIYITTKEFLFLFVISLNDLSMLTVVVTLVVAKVVCGLARFYHICAVLWRVSDQKELLPLRKTAIWWGYTLDCED